MAKSKILLSVLCVVLVAAVGVLGTLAYLTSTATVVNTFTVGNVTITMTEQQVGTDGVPVGDLDGDGDPDRNTGNVYHLIPGKTYTKDPTVFVDADSEDAWLFVKVINDLSALEASSNTVAAQMATNGWSVVDATNNVYAYRESVEGGDEVPVFGSFTIDGEADVSAVTANDTITVTAYAIQADGFDTAAAAWTAAGSSF